MPKLKEDFKIEEFSFKDILDLFPKPVFIKNIKGEYIYCNKEFLNISQRKMDQVIGHTVYDLLPKDKALELEKADKQLLKDGKEKEFNMQLIDPDGNIRYVNFHRQVLKEGKRQIGVVGVMSDITEQTINNERLQLALTATEEGLWDWYIPTNDVYFSPRWKSMLGYRDNELNNDFSTWEKLLHPDDFKESKQRVMDQVSGKAKGTLDIVFRMRHKNGSFRTIHSKALLVKSDKGKPKRMIGTHTDITDQIRKNDRLEKFYKGFETSPNSMVLVDYIDGKPSIKDVNQSFTTIYGYTKEEVLGQQPNTLKSGQHDSSFYEVLWKSILDPKIGKWSGEIVNKRKDGTLVPVILTINSIFDDQGNIKSFLANHTDISELKETINTLEEFNEAVVGRELKMIELKEKIKKLEEKK